MIEKIDLKAFVREYRKFQQSEDYAGRKSQLRFVEIAQLILKEFIKRDNITNDNLTSLIQMLAFNCTKETFLKHLKKLELPNERENLIYDKFIDYGETGHTGRGKFAIRGLDESQLEAVHELLKSVSEAKDKEEVRNIWEKYKDKRVPQVTSGIFSPWLYYLQPKICPLATGHAAEFYFKKLGWQRDVGYGDLIDFFDVVKKLVGEQELGLLDRFFLEPELTDRILIDVNRKSDGIFQALIENKNQIIFYGPPGTGKTYKTKAVAVDIIEGSIISGD